MSSPNRKPSVIGGATRIAGKSISLAWQSLGWAIRGTEGVLNIALDLSQSAREKVRSGYDQAELTQQLLRGKRKHRRVSKAQQVLHEELGEKGDDEVLS